MISDGKHIFMAAAANFLKSLQGYCGYKAAADTSVRQGDVSGSSGTVWPVWVMTGHYWCFLAVTAYSPRQQIFLFLAAEEAADPLVQRIGNSGTSYF
mmetsp:Transcript_6549/g.6742  ORF Transcript_6549/g.6742 Transcript_6549/m.6742 type:complete len:97 (+) Transcript_6549:190-480(+)